MKIFKLLFAFSLVSLNLYGQIVKNGIEIRPRLLIDNGYLNPKLKSTSTHGYITQRSRFFAEYSYNTLEVFCSIQDVRFWGDNITNNQNKDATIGLDLAQGWVKLELSPGWNLKIGRQVFSYDDERILAERNWKDNQVANDALLITYKKMHHAVDASLSWNTDNKNNLIYPDEKYRIFNFLHYQYSNNNFTFSNMNILTAKNSSDTSTSLWKMATQGLFITYKTKVYTIQSSIYYQYTLDNKIGKSRAYCYSLNGWLHSNNSIKLSFGAGVNYLSGQSMTKASNNYQATQHTFNLLMGKRHGYYGYIDYFSSTPNQGIQNYMINMKMNINKNVQILFDFHLFWLAEDFVDKKEGSNIATNKFLGKELDLSLKWEINKDAILKAGYSFYVPTSTLVLIKNITEPYRFPQFAYLMLTIKPQWQFEVKK